MQRTQRKERKVRIWIIFIVLLALFILHTARVVQPVENMLVSALSPLQSILYSTTKHTQSNETEAVSDMTLEELQERYSSLVESNEETLIENAQLKTLVQESSLLEEQVEFLKHRALRGVSAKIISRATEGLSQSLIINRGKADGLQNGYPVIIENGVLIGTVRSTEDHIAEVQLLTSFNSRVSATVQNDQQSPGIISGEHNLSLEMQYIPQPDTLHIDDTVVTSGSDPSIPFGLVIGQIQEIRNEPGSLFQAASARPLFSSSDVLIVSVLIP